MHSKKNPKSKYWISLIIWMGIIYILSSSLFSSGSTEKVLLSWDAILRHIAHIVEYFILFILFYRATNRGLKLINYTFIIISILGSFIYAISDEGHQYFVPGRHFRWIDVGFDSIGIMLGAIIICFMFYLKKRNIRLIFNS